jgi:hypothetical protein
LAQPTFEIFISHVDEDSAIAVSLKELLEEIFLSAQCFVSGRDLDGGQLWFEELRKKLGSSVAIVSLISEFSRESRWVYFESGAGFVNQRTIPLAVPPLTVDSIQAPMKLLQARALHEEGLKKVACDIAKLAGIRAPSRFPGLEKATSEVDAFLRMPTDAQAASDRKPGDLDFSASS